MTNPKKKTMRSITVEAVNNKEEDDARVNEEQRPNEVEPPALVPRPRAIQELESSLDGRHWGDGTDPQSQSLMI